MADPLGSETRPLRIAIIGSGPSGFYAASALLKADVHVQVDMFDRLPAPYGLVRYGVAPDHAKIKNVTKVYEKTAQHPQCSFLGNVTVGKDISVEELKQFYDGLIFTCGAETDRKLGIPGEDLPGSYTATEFVAWYNGHPDYQDRQFDLSGPVAVIIGQGNVAMDVCRILSKTVDELKRTDITQHALEVLAQSRIKEVHMIGRRGPVQAAFTPVEIREFGALADCDAVIHPEDLQISDVSQAELDDPANAQRRKNFEIMQQLAGRAPTGKSRRFVVHFQKSPVALHGDDCLRELVLEKNALVGEPGRQKAKGTGEEERMACDILFRSVGYRGLPIEGVPFHEQWGSIHNNAGRVTDGGEAVVSGLYTAGWIKRGPSGVIGTNKPDSEETVSHLLADLDQLAPCATPDTRAVLELLTQRNVRVVSFEDWQRIDAAEVTQGQRVGKPREKLVSLEDMLAVL